MKIKKTDSMNIGDIMVMIRIQSINLPMLVKMKMKIDEVENKLKSQQKIMIGLNHFINLEIQFI
jgi:hypothetical protein